MSQGVPQHASRFDETFYPTARTEDLERTEAKGEVLLYDKRLHHIHHLDPEVTAVWHHCDGRSSIAMISTITGIREERIRLALDELSQRHLLISELPSHLRIPRTTRRRIAKLGLAALPGIVSVSAPVAADADSEATIACIPYNEMGCSASVPCCTNIVPSAFCLDEESGNGLCN